MAFAARGKLSVMSGRRSGAGLYKGVGFGGDRTSGLSCFGTGSFSKISALKSNKLNASTDVSVSANMVCRNLPCESNMDPDCLEDF